MEGSSFSFFDLPNDQLTRLENICSEFERELRAQNEPQVPDFIGDDLDEPSRLYLLSVMIPMELEFQGKVVTKKAIDSFIKRYPEFAELTSKVFAKLDLTWVSEDNQRTIRRDQTVDPALKFWPGEMVDERYRITTLLGSGSFGVVYRAHDNDLRRDVALKVSSNDSSQAIAMKERFLVEAQSSARLKSVGIATIYDVFTKDDKVFIVQEFVQGRTLAQVLSNHDYEIEQALTLVTEMAKAISHAHACKTFHRDLKPSNIIINSTGQPTIVDFGLATTAHASAMTEVICGTPNYMSPEQVRGEVNRTDAKSDLWSIGVILYELLTGRKPFDAEEIESIFDRIKSHVPIPVTEFNTDIPAELNRIVMRCLAKKKRDRYDSVDHLVDELERYRELENQFDTDTRLPERIIPKGLRAFSFEDNEFFMQMLPGPRDFRGVPESILFWKNQIENLGAFDVFPVGMIYGASGCGKSSFVKAGLLPLLASNIQHIYVESTRHETEIRILKALRRKFPKLDDEVSLPNAIANIRDGGFLAEDEKLLIVVDQFEQWLAFNDGKTETQLLNAMRHCDGAKIQCLLLIREEYWTKAGEFMDQLEIPLVQNENYRSIELFDFEHARKLLEQFGRAYEKFEGELNEGQIDFLDRAIDELGENGRVVGARLTLFAEALRNKDWTIESLGMFGGADGVGVAFLNDTFVDSSAPQRNKMHCQAAQNCLAALLPENRSNLKGHMVAKSQLLTISGYHGQSSSFDEMLDVLDKELRLVTSTKPSGEEVEAAAEATETHYQLSHDYLVPILRRWIDSEKQRKISGRVQARMAQVASVWSEIGHQRYLPTLSETVSFLALSKWKEWTPIQNQMMWASVRKHIPAFLAIGIFAILTVWGGSSFWQSLKHDRLVSDLLQMSISEVSEFAEQRQGKDNDQLVQKVRSKFNLLENADVSSQGTEKIELQKTNLALLLAKMESTNWPDVAAGILAVDIEQVPVLAQTLAGNESDIAKKFESELSNNTNAGSEYAIRQALSLAEWGKPEALIEIALEAGSHYLLQYVRFLEPHETKVLGVLDSKVADLEVLVPKYATEELTDKFVTSGGCIGRLGAVVFSAKEEKALRLIDEAWSQGYVPSSFRYFKTENGDRVTVCWQRAFRELTDDAASSSKVINASDLNELEEAIQKFKNWSTIDISSSIGHEGQTIYTALLQKRAKENRLEFGQTYDELKQAIRAHTADGFQVSRMFVDSYRFDSPTYSTIWEKVKSKADLTIPTFCYPSVSMATSNSRLILGADHADCHLIANDLENRDWFGLRESMRKDKQFIRNYVEKEAVKITTTKSEDFLSHFTRIRRLNLTANADKLATRFLLDLPDWTDGSVAVAEFYSRGSDESKFRKEIDRVKSFEFLNNSSTQIKIPCCELRFEVANGDLDSSERLYQKITQNLNQQIKKYTEEFDAEHFAIEIIKRGLVRVHLVMGKAYPADSSQRKQLVNKAVDILLTCGPRNYFYLLSDQDFDIARSNKKFQYFLWKQKFGAREIKTWRIDESTSTHMDEQSGLSNMAKSANVLLENNFMPRTTSCIYDPFQKLILNKTIWEKNESQLTFKNKKRLANAAVILFEFGQTHVAEMITQGIFGNDVKAMLPEKIQKKLIKSNKIESNLD